MATETAEPKKVSKLDAVLNKIDAFFDSLMSSKKKDDEPETEDDDDMEAEATPAAPATKKATDDEDSQDPDDDNDDDEDEDPDKDEDAKKAAAEIAELKATIAKQNVLLKEAKTALQEKDETIRESIKSTFKPTGSQRSTKKATESPVRSWAQPTTEIGKKAANFAAKTNKK